MGAEGSPTDGMPTPLLPSPAIHRSMCALSFGEFTCHQQQLPRSQLFVQRLVRTRACLKPPCCNATQEMQPWKLSLPRATVQLPPAQADKPRKQKAPQCANGEWDALPFPRQNPNYFSWNEAGKAQPLPTEVIKSPRKMQMIQSCIHSSETTKVHRVHLETMNSYGHEKSFP